MLVSLRLRYWYLTTQIWLPLYLERQELRDVTGSGRWELGLICFVSVIVSDRSLSCAIFLFTTRPQLMLKKSFMSSTYTVNENLLCNYSRKSLEHQRSSCFNISKVRCRIHPSVIMTMLDSHGRLRETEEFSIGTLLGYVTVEVGGTVIDVIDCFTNPYHWDCASSSLTIQKESHDWMLKLKEKLNPRLGVVGWCCTTDIMLYTTALSDWVRSEQKISRLYASKTLCEPIHILVNPRYDKSLSILNEIKVFIRGSLRQVFHPVPFEIVMAPAHEKTISAIIKNSKVIQSSPSELDGNERFQNRTPSVLESLKTIQFYIKPCLLYIEQILARKIVPDESLGCRLMEAVSSHTLISKDELHAKYAQEVQDALLITYLKNLASLQFSIAEKLNTPFN